MASSLRDSPTVETLVAFVVVYCAQSLLALSGTSAIGLLALSLPLDHRPWTLVTSVYAHASLFHLLTNAIALFVVGSVVEEGSSRRRFHAFFVGAGTVAGVTQVTVSALLGTPAIVLGASGAVFALLGYVLTGNRLTGALFDRLDPSALVQTLVFVALAAVLTLATGAPGVALVAHFTGLVVGFVAGRLGVLAG